MYNSLFFSQLRVLGFPMHLQFFPFALLHAMSLQFTDPKSCRIFRQSFERERSSFTFYLLNAKVGRSGGSFSKQAIARRRWLVHNHPECIELNCYCALKLLHMWYDKTQFSIEIIISSTLKEECDRSELNLFFKYLV